VTNSFGEQVISEIELRRLERERQSELRVLREQILKLTGEYGRLHSQGKPFLPGKSVVQYSGRVYDEREIVNLVDSGLEFWLTAGRYSNQLEKALARFIGVEFCYLVNSGSSANLLAFAALCSPKLGDRRISKGDEVITVAAGFPTTVAPMIQYGAKPVFVDVDLETANIDVGQLEAALSSRTRAVMVAHTLGNPFDLDAVLAFCKLHGLWLIEDNCDALGSTYASELPGSMGTRRSGSFGHLSTCSFYPAHHITTGEGGAVFTSDPELESIVVSLRDWGRDCWCDPGKSNTCGERFCQQFGELPFGYDHKYVYSHFGYNLKMSDMQAAVGLAQLEKLPDFITARRNNHDRLRLRLEKFPDIFSIVQATPKSQPSWFGFLMIVNPRPGFARDTLAARLEENKIQTRMLFAGNILRQPCFDEIRNSEDAYRVVGELTSTDRLMNDSLWIGVYPGMTESQIDYMADTIEEFALKAREV
jgi:CDP-6-deoxy-D-xylo-4-hexulose-3-dehydrase